MMATISSGRTSRIPFSNRARALRRAGRRCWLRAMTWLNPASGQRERGVFKVLKPHIPEYFAEDMDYLQGLAQFFSGQHRNYGFPANLLPDTFRKVRRLLQHEVNFKREQ